MIHPPGRNRRHGHIAPAARLSYWAGHGLAATEMGRIRYPRNWREATSLLVATATETVEILSLVGSVVSVVLAGFAIWQASTFYRWSNQASKDAKRSADAVGESVRKLEELFDRLYSDTFGMMRDTVSDMRKHMWPATAPDEERSESDVVQEIDRRDSENVARVREEVMSEIRGLVERVGSTAAQVADLEGSLRGVLDKAISGSREAAEEAIQDTIRERLIAAVDEFRHSGRHEVRAGDLLEPLFGEFDPSDVHDAFVALKRDGVVDWAGDAGWVDGPRVRVLLRDTEMLAPARARPKRIVPRQPNKKDKGR